MPASWGCWLAASSKQCRAPSGVPHQPTQLQLELPEPLEPPRLGGRELPLGDSLLEDEGGAEWWGEHVPAMQLV